MMLYLYPEEWTGRRAREVHTLSTCVALARAGRAVTLVTAGGETLLRSQLKDIAGDDGVPSLELVFLSRTLGPIRSAGIFAFQFRRWLRARPAIRSAFAIHLKAAQMLQRAGIPYAFEAHEIFAETREAVAALENGALTNATVRIATSSALAEALAARYRLPGDFQIVPNAGMPPLAESVADADGPFVYGGSIADWKGLDLIIAATREAQVPLRIVGGSAEEWRELGARADVRHVSWQPRVPVSEFPAALAGARAGLIPTRAESGSGRYSCPMKIFDYARCGLPVICTDLPSLASMNVGGWCTLVHESTAAGWTEALRNFDGNGAANEALAWSAGHTWAARAELLMHALPGW